MNKDFVFNSPTQNHLYTFESIRSIAVDKMVLYHVALSMEDGFPEGTGFLVKFKVRIKDLLYTTYGILTASHVAQRIRLLLRQSGTKFLLLSKPIFEQDIGCKYIHNFEFHEASKIEFFSCFSKKDTIYTADLAFIEIPFEQISNIQLFEHSDFFDLDSEYISLPDRQAILSGFYRLACKKVVSNILRDTGDYFGGGEYLSSDINSKVSFWTIPTPKKFALQGASGAAFWTCHILNDRIVPLFAGIMTQQTKNREYAFATSSWYIKNSFLPALKKEIERNG